MSVILRKARISRAESLSFLKSLFLILIKKTIFGSATYKAFELQHRQLPYTATPWLLWLPYVVKTFMQSQNLVPCGSLLYILAGNSSAGFYFTDPPISFQVKFKVLIINLEALRLQKTSQVKLPAIEINLGSGVFSCVPPSLAIWQSMRYYLPL